MADNDDDKKVKDLIDAGTRADLERWFGLPSFEQLAEQEAKRAPPENPESAAALKRRDEALAAVDPVFLDAHHRRVERSRDLVKPLPPLELRVERELALFNLAMVERQREIAEPREVEIPTQLQDDLRMCAPQALLRDLHRPAFEFSKVFEWLDPIGQPVDFVAIIDEAMSETHRLPPSPTDHREAREIFVELRALRLRPWTELTAGIPGRVTE
jgi:hypothetical protein